VSLPWKGDSLDLSNHYQLSLNRSTLLFESPEIMSEYKNITNRFIQEHLVKEIMEEIQN